MTAGAATCPLGQVACPDAGHLYRADDLAFCRRSSSSFFGNSPVAETSSLPNPEPWLYALRPRPSPRHAPGPRCATNGSAPPTRASHLASKTPTVAPAGAKGGGPSPPSATAAPLLSIPELPAATLAPPPVVPPPAAAPEELLSVSPESLRYEAGHLGGRSGRTSALGGGGGPRDELQRWTLEYLRLILTSRVYDVAIESPLERASKLSERLGNSIFLKREDMQQVFSFKLRGAYNMMAQLPPAQLARGVICSSAGNHAQGVALAAARLGCPAVIAMPVTTPEIKWRSVERLGAEVVLVGDAYDETQAYAKRRAAEEGRVFVPPFDHVDVIAGQGTVGMEIVRQHPGRLHAVFVPVGGGGLLAGIAAYLKSVRPEVLVIGVEPADANAMALSMWHGRRVQLEHCGGFADGVAVKQVGVETFALCRELCDGIVLVSRDAICAAIKDMFEETRSILEPAGALAIAGAKAYLAHYGLREESVVAVASGANMNFDRLRVVTDLAGVGGRREAILATSMPERPGSFKTFCTMVGGDIPITEFKYRYVGGEKAHVLYSVGVCTDEALSGLMARMENAGLHTINMTGNDLAKDHLRHLVGGRTEVPNEVLYKFVFPERPGALLKFLDALSPRWNITLFHYRSQGEMGANVLVGVQIFPPEEDEFRRLADQLGYEYSDERNNEAFLLFMR